MFAAMPSSPDSVHPCSDGVGENGRDRVRDLI
jgi:hypothetical protein